MTSQSQESRVGQALPCVTRRTQPRRDEIPRLEGLQEKARRWPTDAELEDAFLRRALYRKPGTRQSFFVLKRIAEHMEGKESPQIVQGVSATDYSIEHILPQNLTMQWQKDLATWKDPNPQETWLTHRHTIGNLTLTAYNSELADKPFSSSAVPMDKKRWISEHLRLKMSRSVLDKDQWTRAEIEARSKEMSKVAVKIWPRSS